MGTVAQAIHDWRSNGTSDMVDLSAFAVRRMREFWLRYPRAGYGGAFHGWLGARGWSYKYPDAPSFLILDGMNLSHIERCFADSSV